MTSRDPQRLPVPKTPKLFAGGKFIRPESGRYRKLQSSQGQFVANVPMASRKDLRDALRAARLAQPAWAAFSPLLRSQILYRAAEMLEHRETALATDLEACGATPTNALAEVRAASDRLVHLAGWCDKLGAVFGSPNAVAGPFENTTRLEPCGVAVAFAPETPPLLAAASLTAALTLSGNAAVLIVPPDSALAPLSFAEVLATSDFPPGVVNILSGSAAELLPIAAEHRDVDALVDATGDDTLRASADSGTAANLKRVAHWPLTPAQWFEPDAIHPYRLLHVTEFKTVWQTSGF